MLDVRCWMFDVGCSMLDVRCWMFDVGCSILETPTSSIQHPNIQFLEIIYGKSRNYRCRTSSIQHPNIQFLEIIYGKSRNYRCRVAIIGVGQSTFVRQYPGSIRELAFDGFKEAMQDAQTTAKDIGASVICSAPEYDKQRSPAGVFAEYLGLNPQPTFYVETLCSSSSMGLRLAYSLVKSGLHDSVAVIGFQKMSEISSAESQERMGRGGDIQWESPFGTMMPAYYAMYARAANEEKAKAFCKKPVWIMGTGAATTAVNLAGRDLFSGLTVAEQAADEAYKMAGITAKDVDVAEVHDCFTIAEMMAYENLGFAKPGEGKDLIQGKETYKEGSIPVNVDGGLLSKGHPIGATGGSQIRTVVLQLRGEAGDIQVKDPAIGLVHNIGGVGLYGNVTILGR